MLNVFDVPVLLIYFPTDLTFSTLPLLSSGDVMWYIQESLKFARVNHQGELYSYTVVQL